MWRFTFLEKYFIKFIMAYSLQNDSLLEHYTKFRLGSWNFTLISQNNLFQKVHLKIALFRKHLCRIVFQVGCIPRIGDILVSFYRSLSMCAAIEIIGTVVNFSLGLLLFKCNWNCCGFQCLDKQTLFEFLCKTNIKCVNKYEYIMLQYATLCVFWGWENYA